MAGERVLAKILEAVRKRAPDGVVVFDLDSTLLDNRPRQVRIFQDFGQEQSIPELAAVAPEHWKGWDLRAPLVTLGLTPERIDALYPTLKSFWRDRFFTSEYSELDVPITGAPAFVSKVAQAGAQVVYLTGRHEGMRRGTVKVLAQFGFPAPPGNGHSVHLLMKPTLDEDDDAFKAAAHAKVKLLGFVVAAFDNEPTHANDLLRSFPAAIVVHLETDHSGRAIALAPGIPSIPHFGQE